MTIFCRGFRGFGGFKGINGFRSFFLMGFAVLYFCSCVPGKKTDKPEPVGDKAKEAPAVEPRVESRKEPQVAAMPDPPAGPDLEKMVFLWLEMDAPARIAESLGSFLPFPVVSPEKIDSALTKAMFSVFNVKKEPAGVDTSRPLVLAAVTSLVHIKTIRELMGAMNQPGDYDFTPRLVARVPVKGSGDEFLRSLGENAQESLSTPWGGHMFKNGTKTLWVHVKGPWAVLTTEETFVGSAWRLFKSVKLKEIEGSIRAELYIQRFHTLLKSAFPLMSMFQSRGGQSGMPMSSGFKYGKYLKLAGLALGVLVETGTVALEFKASKESGLSFKMMGAGFRGYMKSWLDSLIHPETKLLNFVPEGAPFVSLATVMDTERGFWVTAFKSWWIMTLGSLDGVSDKKRTALTINVGKALDDWVSSLGKSRMMSLYFEKDSSPSVLFVYELNKPKVFFEAMKNTADFAGKELTPILEKLREKRESKKAGGGGGVLGVLEGKGSDGKKKGDRTKPGYRITKRMRRFKGVRVQEVILSRRKRKRRGRSNRELKSMDYLFSGDVVFSAMEVNGYGIIHIGQSRGALAGVLSNLKGGKRRKRKEKASLGGLAALLGKGAYRHKDVSSLAGLDWPLLIKGISGLLKKRTPALLKRLKTRVPQEEKEKNERLAGKIKEANKFFGKLTPYITRKGEPGKVDNPDIAYKGVRSGSSYTMTTFMDDASVKRMKRWFESIEKDSKKEEKTEPK